MSGSHGLRGSTLEALVNIAIKEDPYADYTRGDRAGDKAYYPCLF